jgi:hypothetical protein
MFGGWWESMFGELEIILDGPRLWGTLMESCFEVLAGRSGFRDSSLWHFFVYCPYIEILFPCAFSIGLFPFTGSSISVCR